MKSRKQKIVVIVGPTASGKSELAVRLAKKFKGEIISADSRQIYRDLDIGTGKVNGRWVRKVFLYKKVPHYCIDVVSPKRIFTAAEYKKCAEAAIEDISSRGKIPIIVGGTGFWIDAVVYDLNLPQVPPNKKLRKRLEGKNTKELLKMLQKFDPNRARTVEQKNPRRLIRAIEIAKILGNISPLKKMERYYTNWIGLNPGYKTLRRKIKHRAAKMLKGGLPQETKKLLQKGVSVKRIKEFGFEYKIVLDYLNKKISLDEARQDLIKETLRYAHRQMTWFKRNRKIKWRK